MADAGTRNKPMSRRGARRWGWDEEGARLGSRGLWQHLARLGLLCGDQELRKGSLFAVRAHAEVQALV